MRRSLLLLLLLPICLRGQEKKITYDNQELVDYFTRNLHRIEKVDGIDWVCVPTEQTIKENEKLVFVEGYPVQYRLNGKNVELIPIKTKMRVFNFKTKKITSVNSNNDNDVWSKPQNIKEKIKKNKEKEK